MDDINRMQQLAGIQEIKVNNPNKNFKITEKGIEYVNNFSALEQLASKFDIGELLHDKGPESDKFAITQLLYIFSDTYGEGIIKMKTINIYSEFISKYTNIWDPDEDTALKDLKLFYSQGYITPIQL